MKKLGLKLYNAIQADAKDAANRHAGTPPPPADQDFAGRNLSLLERRNECLIARYYYYTVTSPTPYDEMIARLQQEFYLTHITIHRIIASSTIALTHLRRRHPPKTWFRERWAWMVWG